MTTLTWDAVGGDPAPGDPGAFNELARGFSQTAADAADAKRRLDRFRQGVDDSIWRGDSAAAFKDKIDKLPGRLEKLHASYSAAASGMSGYARTLRDLQEQARRLLSEAEAARSDQAVQERGRDQALAVDPTVPTTHHDDAIAAAQSRFTGANHRLDDLRDRRRTAENTAIGRLQEAGDLGIANDSWWKRTFDAVGNWVDEHADILKTLSEALKIVSAIAGVLSFIPFLAPICGPIALIAGGLALLTDAALAATGNGSWKMLLVDGALMALPGAGTLVGGAVRSRRAVRHADGSVDLSLRYKRGWSAAQRSAADGKVHALNQAELRVTKVQRSGKSARSRYQKAGQDVPPGHDVDHVVDLQLGGADDVANMKPLDSSVNRSLGSQIHHRIKRLDEGTRVNSVSIYERPSGGTPVGVNPMSDR